VITLTEKIITFIPGGISNQTTLKGDFTMRWKFPLLIVVILVVTALPFIAAAQEGVSIIEPLDFTLDSEAPLYPGESGEGWTWDAESKTLTLSGINLEVGFKLDEFAIKLPDGAKIM
jgi:hypothetical protein